MGRARQAVRDWFKDDPAQREWAANYLRKKRADHLVAPVEAGYEFGLRVLERDGTTPAGRLLLDAMRGAWNRQKANRRSGKSTHSYSLTRGADRQLGVLTKLLIETATKPKTKSGTLEYLIQNGVNLTQAALKELIDEVNRPKRLLPTPEERKAYKEIEGLKAALKEQDEVLDQLLFENCKYEALAQAHNLLGTTLLPDQQIKVQEAFEARKRYYENDIKSKRARARKAASGDRTASQPSQVNDPPQDS